MENKNHILKRMLACAVVVFVAVTATIMSNIVGLELPKWSEAFATRASAFSENGYTYTVTDGKATITGCDDSISGDVVIPDMLGGYPVTSIGDKAFRNCTGLTSVIIPDSVTSIGEDAFYGCTGLKNVTIGKSVTNIGESAFADCIGLTKINLNAEKIKSLSYLGECGCCYHSVFSGAGTAGTGLKVVFGDNVKSIPDYAFEYCTSLKSLTIGKSVKSIGYSAFSGCTKLTRINWNAENVDGLMYAEDGYPFYLSKKVFLDAGTAGDGLHVVFGNNVKTIPAYAFCSCSGLTSVTIGRSVKNIGDAAFLECTGLKTITIPDSVTSISDLTFYRCTGLTSVTIPNSVTSIGDYAFSDCDGLKSVTIPNSVTSIGYSAFYYCTGLTSVTIPDSVKKIGSDVFFGCNTQIRFTGKPPAFSSYTFSGLKGTVLYPYKISEWKSAIKSKYGGQFTWVCYSKGKLTELKIKSMPKKTVYYQGQTANYSGLSLSAKWSDGFSAVITPDSKIYDVSIAGFSSKTPGLKTVTATVGGKSVKFRLGVHKLNTFTENKSKYPESAHNYANNLNETKIYKCPDAFKLVVTFSNKTYVEQDGDYIYVNGTRYTGNQLAGKTITIKGDTLTVKLVSDDYGKGYGYSIDKIVITRVEHVNKTKITPATTSKDGTVVTACEACGKVAKKAVIYKVSSVKLSKTAFTYNGKVQTPTVTVKDSSGKVLKNGTDYTVKYSSGRKNPGQYSVTVTFKGNYSGAKTLTYTIAPGTPTLTVTAGAKKAMLKWDKQTGATGYVVYMATSKNGSYTKVATVKGNSRVTYTKTGLTKGKTYYFKVCAYTTVGGKTINGAFSAVKSAKIK